MNVTNKLILCGGGEGDVDFGLLGAAVVGAELCCGAAVGGDLAGAELLLNAGLGIVHFSTERSSLTGLLFFANKVLIRRFEKHYA